MAKFAIRSISKETMALPPSDQNRYYSSNWSLCGARLVCPKDPTLLTFRSQRAAEEFITGAANIGFINIRAQEL